MADAARIIDLLGMQPHPEGGHYVEIFREAGDAGGRGACTAIYFLLQAGEVSAWHRVRDATEIWHWYAGAPLVLTISENGHDAAAWYLGTDLEAGHRPQVVVPANAWQTAESLGRWTLVGCTVSPAFEFDGFELAPPGWRPAPRPPRSGR
jgi:predicted cupin superfamily sugar epimerase